jgi:hypothetical protein
MNQTWLARTLGTLCAVLVSVTAAADAPKLRYTTVDGTVKDNRTSLTWQLAVDPTLRNWVDARSYCAQLPLSNGGWRLPTLKELLTLIDPTRLTSPVLDTGVFVDAPAGLFWSSNVSVVPVTTGSPSDFAWSANFSDGTTNSSGKISDTYRVRCVR